MVKLFVMVGLQCSGKSTEAKNLAKEFNAEIVSSDQLRIEHPEYNNDSIFKLLYSRVNNLLSIKRNVIIDATNITIKSRRHIFLNIKEPCEKICYIMNVPYNECQKRLDKRNQDKDTHYVPKEVLEKYYYSFEIPFFEEGWDEIKLYIEPEFYKGLEVLSTYKSLAEGFNQKNKHHCQDLGQHMNTVGDLIKKETQDAILIKSAYYHDIGKLFTQTYKPGDENAHYYNHANVGAYSILSNVALYEEYYSVDDEHFVLRIKDTIDWIFYINYHMHIFNITTEKSIKKWKQIFGEEKFNNLLLLNKYDKNREDLI